MGRARELAEVATAYDSGGLNFRNRIINGDMRIDQRNAGASVAISANNAAFTIDRFRADAPFSQGITVQRSTVVPAGFTNSLLFTAGTGSTNAGDVPAIQQFIEGFNVADLGWGTASAQAVTISFWVRSSLTGNFGLSLRNSAANRTYVASFSISAANTYEYKTLIIPGDTGGTWLTDNGRGITVMWDMGVGTTNSIAASSAWGTAGIGLTGGVKLTQNTGATFYITGVQLEAGSVATPFERRDYGRELMMCQRYFQKNAPTPINIHGFLYTGSVFIGTVFYKVDMRAAPTVSITSGVNYVFGLTDTTNFYFTGSSGGSYINNWTASAEL